MKVEVIRFIIYDDKPIVKRKVYNLKKCQIFSKISSGGSYKLSKTGFFKLKLEIKSNDYRNFKVKEKNENINTW